MKLSKLLSRVPYTTNVKATIIKLERLSPEENRVVVMSTHDFTVEEILHDPCHPRKQLLKYKVFFVTPSANENGPCLNVTIHAGKEKRV